MDAQVTNWHDHPLLLLPPDITLIIQKHILFRIPFIINKHYSYNDLKSIYFKYISFKLGEDISNSLRLQNKLKKEILVDLMSTKTIRKAILPFYRDCLYNDLIQKFGKPIESKEEYPIKYKVGDLILNYHKGNTGKDDFLKDYIENKYFNLQIFKIEKISKKTYTIRRCYIYNYIFKSKIDDFQYRKSFKDECHYDIDTRELIYKYDTRYNINDLEFILDYKIDEISERMSIPEINSMNNLLISTSINFVLNQIPFKTINEYFK